MSQIISLKAAGVDLTFEPTIVAYNQMSNDAAKEQNVIGALRDYLLKIATPDCREALAGLLAKHPGAVGQIAKVVNEQFAPEIEIELKL